MASSKEYLRFVEEALSGLEGVSYRAMMGEFLIYYRDKVVGGIYDDRILLKPVPAARAAYPEASLVLPYEGGKAMLLADADDKEGLKRLLPVVYDELPPLRPKKKKPLPGLS